MIANGFIASGLIAGAHAQSESAGDSDPASEPPAVTTDPAQSVAPEPVPTVASVHVVVENVESSRGTVWVALCNIDLSVEGCPYKKGIHAAAGFVEVTFENIPPGIYAVAGYHDVNNNEEFDKLLGVPREPYALSGEAGEMLVPTFDAAALQMNAGNNDVIIRMKRLGG
jgi:uncharacterized protein (DUF2141 family)